MVSVTEWLPVEDVEFLKPEEQEDEKSFQLKL
jgi:hypothetical protein